jgi:hypothetical protein
MHFYSYVYFFVLLIVTLFGVVNFKKLTTPFKLLTSLIGVTIVSEAGILICSRLFQSALPVYHIVAFYEYIFYSLIYYHLFKSHLIKSIILSTTFIIPAFAIVNSFFLQPYMRVFPSNLLLISNILCAIFAMLLFREMLFSPVQTKLFKRSAFWYNTAVLFFSVAMFFVFGVINYILKYQFHSRNIANFSHIINLLFYIAFWYSIYLNIKEQKPGNE